MTLRATSYSAGADPTTGAMEGGEGGPGGPGGIAKCPKSWQTPLRPRLARPARPARTSQTSLSSQPQSPVDPRSRAACCGIRLSRPSHDVLSLRLPTASYSLVTPLIGSVLQLRHFHRVLERGGGDETGPALLFTTHGIP